MMHRQIRIALLISAAVFCASASVNAQINNTPPDTSFTYADAKDHDHGAFTTTLAGYYAGRGLQNDATNDGGDNFYGNTVCVAEGGATRCFWYRWAADPHVSGQKIQNWMNQYPWGWIEITFDPVCLLVFTAHDPYTADPL